MWVGSPAASVVEEVVEDWVLSLLGLPAERRRRPGHRRPDGQRDVPGGRARLRAQARRLGRRGPGADRRAAGHRDRRAGGARDRLQRAADDRARPRQRAPRRRRRPGPDGPGRARPRAARRRPRTGDRLRAGRQRQLRRVRSARADRVPVRAERRVAARRRRLRALGRGLTGPAPPHARPRARRQLGHRRPQVAQRPLRRRPGDRRATAPPTAPRWRSARPTSSPASSATTTTSRPRPPAAPAASPSTPRCARSAARASRT